VILINSRIVNIMAKKPIIGIVMGSDSDWPTMKQAADILTEFGVSFENKVVSAHRTPDLMAEYGLTARERGLKAIIAGAGGAAHLPGMLAAYTTLPVIGVPVQTSALGGLDSLYSIVQMPNGVPVATVAIGKAANAGLLALRMLSIEDRSIEEKLELYHQKMADESIDKTKNLT
jgi:5-(carboxyamino)imidazole ribonucleotide mutase